LNKLEEEIAMSRLYRYLVLIGVLIASGFQTIALAQNCPCTIWGASAVPGTQDSGEGAPIELGLKFRADVDGVVTGVRFYKSALNTGTHVGNLWSSSGTLLASAVFTNESGSGWQQVNFTTPVSISAGTTYIASYFTPIGHYAFDASYFSAAGVDNSPLHALANGVDGGNGVFVYSGTSAFPTSTYSSSNYWVDVVFSSTGNTQGPSVTSFSPANGVSAVATTSAVTVTFDKSIDQSTLNGTTFKLLDSSNNQVSAAVSYNSTTRTATLQPNSALQAASTYTAIVVGGGSSPTIKGSNGVPLAASVSWSFATASPSGMCPCTVWTSSSVPTIADSGDVSSVELGVRFRTDSSGFITGIRFYKSALNTGQHIGNLWTNDGVLLATAVFSNESASGWQQVSFSSPVPVTAGTTYVASYFAPVGHYAFDLNYFAFNPTDNAPLHALADNTDGRNGVYAYGASAFPTGTYGAANYWVDVVFNTAIVGDTPTVVASTPANGASGVSLTAPITATFSVAMDGSTINSSSFQLLDSGSNPVPASVSYSSSTNTATLQPTSSLVLGMNYTAVLRGGVIGSQAGGVLAANFTWSFSTGTVIQPPVVVSYSPANGASNVSASATVTATFSKALTASSVNTTTFQLLGPSNAQVAATVTYNSSTFTATLQPAASLQYSTTYTAVLPSGGVKDSSGTPLGSTISWTFTTSAAPPAAPGNCPCSIWAAASAPVKADSGEAASLELGVKFRADYNGYVTGIRFYKSAANLGTHLGSLWSSNGVLLARATFAGESASGWQQVNFSTPVAVTSGTTYVASYFAPQGHYAYDQNYFNLAGVDNGALHALSNASGGGNGLFAYGSSSTFPAQSFNSSNYWVDPVYVPSNATVHPSVISTSPVSNGTSVYIGTPVKAVFNLALNPATVNSGSFQLTDSSNNIIAGTVSYNAASSTLTFTPSAGLAFQTTYTATVRGSVQDVLGNTLGNDYTWTFTTSAIPAPTGPGGPILVITSVTNPFTQYLGEILLAEGLNEYAMQDIAGVSSSTLSGYDVVILGDIQLTAAQASMLSSWVTGGGKLIAMHPDVQLSGLLGLTKTAGTMSNAYLKVNTASGPGVGIVSDTIQYHSSADLYTLSGATALATIYSNATTATAYPAVTQRVVGAGRATAFTYDLARSVVYTRQGNPAWSGQDRDQLVDPAIGNTQIRSDDLFFGAASFDPQPDWIDLNKVQIPQADEQQRLLANMLLQYNAATRPLPRFWYFPSGFKAVVVMTGDDHYTLNGWTTSRFNRYIQQSPTGCSVVDWTCVRATSYVFPASPVSNYQTFINQGFEIANHADNDPSCSTFTQASLEAAITYQLNEFAQNMPGAPASKTNRTHCVLWSDYDTEPQVLLNHGIRLDTSYYFWPQSWVLDRPGMFTGSGMPMRLTDRNGNIFDVFEAVTQMPDETLQTFPMTIDTLLDNATGSKGFYGAFTTNFHMDNPDSLALSDTVVTEAQARGVPVISSQQLLTWLDGRNASSFGGVSWSGNALNFTVTVGSGARNIQAMLPTASDRGTLGRLFLNGNPVSFSVQVIKGIQYGVFTAAAGTYQAYYGYTISGTISGVGRANATLTFSGPATGTVVSDALGNYSFGGLASGTYTVTPSRTGYAYTPSSLQVVINGANVTGQNFTSIGIPLASLSPTSLDFGAQQLNVASASRSVTLTNGGGASLAISGVSISGTNASDFSYTSFCGTTLSAGGSCIISVRFTPTALGARAATLSVADNAAGSPHQVSLAGTGGNPSASLTPSSLSYGNVAVGTSAGPLVATLTNTGSAPMTITSSTITGTNPSSFTRTTTCGSSLAIGASCTYSVTFTPATAGNLTATLSVSDSASGSPHTVALSGTGVIPLVSISPTSINFGGQAVSTTSAASAVTVSNTGIVPVTISSILISGTNSTNFARTTTCGSSLAVGANCTINVTFTPSATGTRTATLTVSDNATTSSGTVSLTGTGLGAVASLSPTSLAFGIVAINTTVTSPTNVTLTNTGNIAMTISNIGFAGTAAGDYTRTTSCGTTLAAGSSCTITVSFRPTALGSRSASLSISDSAPGSPHTVSLSGTGTGISVTPRSLSFGSQAINTTSLGQAVSITNVGTTTITSLTTSITGFNASSFIRTTSCGTSLAVGASCSVTLTFRPTSTGSKSATLNISNSDPTSPQQVTLSGTGI
jgi:hypothetical protein